MHSLRPLCVAHICTFIIIVIALQATVAVGQPTVVKSFDPNPVVFENYGSLRLTLANPGSSALTNVSVADVFPGCLNLASAKVTYDPTGCDVAYGGSGAAEPAGPPFQVFDHASMDNFSLPPGAICTAIFEVEASSFPCPNETNVPHSDQGDGTAASANWDDSLPLVATFTEGAGTADVGNAANWSTTLQDGMDLVFPGGLLNPSISGSLTGTYNAIRVQGAGEGINITANLTAGFVVDVGAGTVLIHVPLTLPKDETIQLISGFPAFTADLNLGGNDLTFLGSGSAGYSGVIGGTGNININGPTVTFGAANTYTGTVQVLKGVLDVNATTTPPVYVFGTAAVTGSSQSFNGITLSGNAIAQPATGAPLPIPPGTQASNALAPTAATPATWTVDTFAMGDGTEVVAYFGSNNTTHSAINATTATIDGGVLKLNFATTPSLVTYGPLITGTTRTGCPTEVVVCSPAHIEAIPLCFSASVSAKVMATDAIMRGKFDEVYESCP